MDQSFTAAELENWISRVSHEFYELVYKDQWFKDIFKVIKQEVITSQQIDFMVGAFGGAKRYAGRTPGDAHPHIFIDEETWQYREALLVQAFENVQCPESIRSKWLKIDNAFKKQIVMTDPAQCQKRYFTDEIIIVPNPRRKVA
jgi:hemoglobin